MKLIGSKSSKKTKVDHLGPSPDEEYDLVAGEQSKLRAQIRDLQGFIEEAPQIRERRQRETRVTLPPLEDRSELEMSAVIDPEETEDEEDLALRLGRRHVVAIRRERRRNFLVFLVSAAAVAAFLYWVSLIVQ